MSRLVASRGLLAPAMFSVTAVVLALIDPSVSPPSKSNKQNTPTTLASNSSLNGPTRSTSLVQRRISTIPANKLVAKPRTARRDMPATPIKTERTGTASSRIVTASLPRESKNLSRVPAPRPKPPVAIASAEKSIAKSVAPHVTAIMAPAEKTTPANRPILASLSVPTAVNAAHKAAAMPLPAEEPQITGAVASPPTPAEKKTSARLGSPATEAVAPAVSEPPSAALTGKAAPPQAAAKDTQRVASLSPAPARYAPAGEDADFRQAKEFPSDSDQTLLEKHASLGAITSRSVDTDPKFEATYVPPEQQRVAYDAPVVTERPQSIGRRHYVDDDAAYSGRGSPQALLEALRHMGEHARALGLPPSLWCADFMNYVLRHVGLDTTGSRAALSFLKYGQRISEPRVGAIAIFSRGRRGGHVGIVRGTDGAGNPIIVSGNYADRVAEAVYPKSRVLAYVVPPEH
jgi:uncharacterized protein (TIGR02594 family)